MANLEQRRQIRYLARHHPDFNTGRMTKIVGCAYSAAAGIISNTYGGGDEDPDELPRDEAFMKKYGVRERNMLILTPRVIGSAGLRRDGDGDCQISGNNAVVGAQETTESIQADSGSPQGPLQVAKTAQTDGDQKDLEWVSDFFNRNSFKEGLKVPDRVLTELIAAGFKKWTVLHMMRIHHDKRDLACYLATVLRVTPVERDTIAALIMERRDWIFRGLKIEE